jgi:hypothetical protein
MSRLSIPFPEPVGFSGWGSLAHLFFNAGNVVLLEPQGNGWRMREIAELPGRSDQLAVVGPDTYAAFTLNSCRRLQQRAHLRPRDVRRALLARVASMRASGSAAPVSKFGVKVGMWQWP